MRVAESHHAERQWRRGPHGGGYEFGIEAFHLREGLDQFVGQIVGVSPALGNDGRHCVAADWEGPEGFRSESIMTVSGACGLRREAAASMGSVAKRKVAAAEAAADKCRKERREKRGMRILRLGSLKQKRRKAH